MGAGLYQEIEAFCRLKRVEMDPWEVSMLAMLNSIHSASRETGRSSPTATTGAGVAAVMRGLKAKKDMPKDANNG